MRLNLRIPQDSSLKQDVFEDFLGAIHFILANHREHITFGVENIDQNLNFFLNVPNNLSDNIKSQLFAFFPDFQVTEEPKSQQANLRNKFKISLKGKKYKKVKCYSDCKVSIIPSIVSVLPDNSRYEIKVKPIKYDLIERIRRDIQRFFQSDAERYRDDIFKTCVQYSSLNTSDNTVESVVALINRLCEKDVGRFTYRNVTQDCAPTDFYFSKDEVASIYYFPYQEAKISQVKKVQFSKSEPPENLPTKENSEEGNISLIGEAEFRNYKKTFGIKREDRDKHMYVVGKSGMGKTFLLKQLMLEDIYDGKGFAFIDPHGDASRELLSLVPKDRINDVIFFNTTDFDHPISFNPLSNVNKKYKHLSVDSFVEIFEKIFGVYWNSRLEHIFRYSTLALLDSPEPSLLGLKNLLTDKDYRQYIIGNVKDPVIKAFWANEFADWKTKYEADSVIPIINKLSQLLANPIIRNIFIQTKSTLDIGQIMNTNKILICNMSSGEIGQENSNFIGSMLVTKLQQSAMERAAIDPDARKDFYLYVDEFQNFATDSFVKIFSEARKYNLNLTIAHQYIKQIPEQIRDTIFGNVGSMIMFRVGMQDAEELLKEFNPPFTGKDMVNLGIQDIYVKLCIDGKTSKPFSARTLSFPEFDFDYSNEIINSSRTKYAKKVEEVEDSFEKLNTGGKFTQEINFEEPIL